MTAIGACHSALVIRRICTSERRTALARYEGIRALCGRQGAGPDTGNRTRATGHWQPDTGNRTLATERWQPGTGNNWTPQSWRGIRAQDQGAGAARSKSVSGAITLAGSGRPIALAIARSVSD